MLCEKVDRRLIRSRRTSFFEAALYLLPGPTVDHFHSGCPELCCCDAASPAGGTAGNDGFAGFFELGSLAFDGFKRNVLRAFGMSLLKFGFAAHINNDGAVGEHFNELVVSAGEQFFEKTEHIDWVNFGER